MNIMSSWYLESANHCSGAFPPDTNEMEVSGLTEVASEVVKPPCVAEAAIQLECEVCYHYPRHYLHFVLWSLLIFDRYR